MRFLVFALILLGCAGDVNDTTNIIGPNPDREPDNVEEIINPCGPCPKKLVTLYRMTNGDLLYEPTIRTWFILGPGKYKLRNCSFTIHNDLSVTED